MECLSEFFASWSKHAFCLNTILTAIVTIPFAVSRESFQKHFQADTDKLLKIKSNSLYEMEENSINSLRCYYQYENYKSTVVWQKAQLLLTKPIVAEKWRESVVTGYTA